jgi:hypothetical protein
MTGIFAFLQSHLLFADDALEAGVVPLPVPGIEKLFFFLRR